MTMPFADSYAAPGRAEPIYGVVLATVTNNQDDKKLGRVKLKYGWRSATDESDWAPVVTAMAGDKFGLFLLPEVNDQVLVLFERGDINKPYVIGSLYTATVKPKPDNADGKNAIRELRSRSGHVVRLDDSDGKERIVIADKTEKNQIVFDSANNTIQVTSEKDLKIEAKGDISLQAKGDVTIRGKSVSIKADQKCSAEAQQELALTCNAGVKINTDGLVVT
jgi:uncharacterized protein involved in type VI secretion and phage assembly